MRLYSTKSFKALGTLVYHKDALQALAFARASPVVAAPNPHQYFPTISSVGGSGGEEGGAPGTDVFAGSRTSGGSGDDDVDDEGDVVDDGGNDEKEDDEMNGEEKARRSRWLVSGGKDGRVVVWGLMNFTAKGDSSSRRED